ncbi:MAG TPA: 50S ribosomal protein L21 [Syntrophorhabdaceae bacterium]|nr:50S ribosomal protein L21 [Syntrophorhabdaceae bacterium]HOL05755.1 50S ribosomal protein L21 [Syntrophorhabdaceae bacterium]HON85574.1 50S ribosomal protein L21 [Syntrophorhabdaceae bacterium]HPP42171.1 50S ribosomal protein L21 [Syntrophorhabdaceae bacterium]
MYAIIENGGKQYKITEGEKIKLEKLPVSDGEEVKIKEVLAVNNGVNTIIGNPYVEGAYISGRVLGQGRRRKVIVFKYKRRKDYKKKIGHRQHFTELLVEKIYMEA